MRPGAVATIAVLLGSAQLAVARRINRARNSAAKRQKMSTADNENICVVEERAVVYTRNTHVAAHGISFAFPYAPCTSPSTICNPFPFFGGRKETLYGRSMIVEQIDGPPRRCRCSFNPEYTKETWSEGDAGFLHEDMVPFGEKRKVIKAKKEGKSYPFSDWCSKKACWKTYSRAVLLERWNLEKKSSVDTGKYIMSPETDLFNANHYKATCKRMDPPKELVTIYPPEVAAKNSQAAAVRAKDLLGEDDKPPADDGEKQAIEDAIMKPPVPEQKVGTNETFNTDEEDLEMEEEEEDELDCTGCKTDECSKEGCVQGCKPGFWGSDLADVPNGKSAFPTTVREFCTRPCPPGCDGPCDEKTGQCSACRPGYTGPTCDEPCHARCATCVQFGNDGPGNLQEHCTSCRLEEPAILEGTECKCINDYPRDLTDLCVCPTRDDDPWTDDDLRESYLEINGERDKECFFRCKETYDGDREKYRGHSLKEVFPPDQIGRSMCITGELYTAVLLMDDPPTEEQLGGDFVGEDGQTKKCNQTQFAIPIVDLSTDEVKKHECLEQEYVEYIQR